MIGTTDRITIIQMTLKIRKWRMASIIIKVSSTYFKKFERFEIEVF